MRTLISDFDEFVSYKIFLHLVEDEKLAYDARFNPEDFKAHMKELRGKIFKDINPSLLQKKIQDFVDHNRFRWLILLQQGAKKIVERFITQTLATTTHAQKQALKSAGAQAEKLIKERWTVPTAKKQFVAPEAMQLMPELLRDNVNLITRISDKDVDRISEVMIRGLSEGRNYDEIRETLKATQGFDEARANRVCRDQINKANFAIQKANLQSIGVKRAIWKHVAGQFTSRESHIKMDGKEFDLNKGLWDEEVKAYVLPSELPFCQCLARPIFDEE